MFLQLALITARSNSIWIKQISGKLFVFLQNVDFPELSAVPLFIYLLKTGYLLEHLSAWSKVNFLLLSFKINISAQYL